MIRYMAGPDLPGPYIFGGHIYRSLYVRRRPSFLRPGSIADEMATEVSTKTCQQDHALTCEPQRRCQ
jgi:hypothetical protein